MDQIAQSPINQPAAGSPLVALFRHNLWANLRLIDACAALDGEQLAATAVGTCGSLFDTLRHIVRSAQHYLTLLTGQETANRPPREQSPALAVICEEACRAGEGVIAYAGMATPTGVGCGADDEDENVVCPIPAGFLLTQAINHATEHRAQVMNMLTRLGIEPPDLSGWKNLDKTVTITPIPRPIPAAGA